MEPAEDASLEPAIRWLAQSLLASPLLGNMDPWVREAGLAEDMEGLKSGVKGVQEVVFAVKGRALGNDPLAESLVELKDLLYDADDAVDELDYWRLLQQLDQGDDLELTDASHATSTEIAEVPITGTHRPESYGTVAPPDPPQTDGHGTQPVEPVEPVVARITTAGKLRSRLWKEYQILEVSEKGAPVRAKCIHCNAELACPTKSGTSVLANHLKTKACPYDPSRSTTDSTANPTPPLATVSLPNPTSTTDSTANPAPPLATVSLPNPTSTTDSTANPAPLLATVSLPNPLSTTVSTANPTPPLATGNLLSSKKRRRDEESTRLITANTNQWNKDGFSKMIRDITLKLRHIREGVIRVLSIPGSDFASCSNHSQGTTSHQSRRTSGTLQGRLYGRDGQKTEILGLMEEAKSATGLTVLPILGVAGVGKTALAQLVYNHQAVKDQFDHMVWIWVSNSFDAMELTKDMLGAVSHETHVGLCNFAKLQEILESRIKSKRILLILDDVWDGISDYQWSQLLSPFNSDNARGNMVIVTTRKPCVAQSRGTVGPIKLKALNNDAFWLFFKARALYMNHDGQDLIDLGQQIAQRLKGNPLAAETAVSLLRQQRTVAHWSSILKNEDWKSLTLSGGIMSAFKLCYDRLPYHLQKCFSYCSLFPCNYRFLAEDLVRIWISQGFVKRNNSSKRLEEIGLDYLAELVNLGFFEQFERTSSSCYYVVYNLMHDFGRVVSRTECATIDGLQCNRMFPTVRHLSIISNSIHQMEDQTGNIAWSEKFEEVLRNTVTSVGNLRSLVLIGQYGSSFFQFFQTVFQKAQKLRLLHLSVTSPETFSLCNLVNAAHLRYLKLENGHAEQGALPQVVSNSFQLQVLDIGQNYPSPNLQENSGEAQVFLSLKRLRCLKRLKLRNMRNVTEVFVPSLEELVLFEMPNLQTCSFTSVGDLKSSLRVLEVQSCPAFEVFGVFEKIDDFVIEDNSWLPSLKKLIIFDCPMFNALIPLPPSATVLEIEGSPSQTLRIKPNSVLGESPCEMTLEYMFLSFHNMRDLQYLEIKDCLKISLHTFGHLISLKSLKIKNSNLISLHEGELPALESLSITKCGITGKLLSAMLQHSGALKELYLDDCPQLTELQIEEDKDILALEPLQEEERNNLVNLFSCMDASSFPQLTQSQIDEDPSIETDLFATFDALSAKYLGRTKRGFTGCTKLKKLKIWGCPKLLSSLVHNDGEGNGRWLLPQSLEELSISEYLHETLRPCFVGNLTCLKKLEVDGSPYLKSLQLDSCTGGMEYLRICRCSSLTAIEGLGSVINLMELNVVKSPVLASLDTSVEDCKRSQLSGLENLNISELSVLTSSFCEGLSRLRSLRLQYLEEPRLTDEHERALMLHGSLQELIFFDSSKLLDLPAGLHNLLSLKTLKINDCKGISRLPKEGLPPSLEELEIESCSHELSAQCRSLATAKLRVKIDGHYI